ncbi:MAG TPA: glycosyltransferase, partial [Ktedonobacterales bacterium]
MISMHTSPLAALGRTRDAGGMNAYIRGLARELGRGGMYVDIFTRRADPSTPIIQFLSDQVRLITLPAGPAIPLPPNELFPYVREFTLQIEHFAAGREHGYNLLHSHYWLSADAALPLAAAWDVPHVTMFHTVERLKHEQYTLREDDSPAARIRIEQERRIAQSVDAIVVSTEHERERLRSLYCLPASRLHVIPCGVDLITFEPGSPTARAEARARLHADERPMLLFVGRLDSIKDLDLLLTGLSRMCEKAVLHIVGGMAQGDPEVERLRALSAKLGVAER